MKPEKVKENSFKNDIKGISAVLLTIFIIFVVIGTIVAIAS